LWNRRWSMISRETKQVFGPTIMRTEGWPGLKDMKMTLRLALGRNFFRTNPWQKENPMNWGYRWENMWSITKMKGFPLRANMKTGPKQDYGKVFTLMAKFFPLGNTIWI